MSVTNIHQVISSDVVAGFFTADAAGRAKIADSFFNEATVDAKFVAGAIDAETVLKAGSVYEDRLRIPTANALGEFRMCRATYDFATLGGVVGNIALTGGTIPDNALVLGGIVDITTTLTSGGAATIGLRINAAGDLIATATAIGAWAAGIVDVIPAYTAVSSIKLTAARQITAEVGAFDLTAGVFNVTLIYAVGA